MECIHAFTVDVEDWYQSSYDINAPISDVCVQNTRKVLGFLEAHRTKGTFFVQGMVAKSFPELVKEIHGQGHEIQSHGFSHRPVNKLHPRDFYHELMETKRRLEDIVGEAIVGFRAPDFSIDERSFWAFEVMREAGVQYDSSLFPMKMRRYGLTGICPEYSQINTKAGIVEELPVSIYHPSRFTRIKIPIGGGGYVRLLPGYFLRYCLKKMHTRETPYVLYCHPYEFNPHEWNQILKKIGLLKRLHQGFGRRSFQGKISSLIKLYSFGTVRDVLEQLRRRNVSPISYAL